MDRLFRKRTASASTSDKSSRHGPRPSAGSLGKSKEKLGPSEAGATGTQREPHSVGGKGGKWATGEEPALGTGRDRGKAPSLDVDIRNSLMLPALSQRFSVLLPSLSTLSTAPEESLRSLIASQRARHNGPALTEEEEELIFAELRGQQVDDGWDGQPPAADNDWADRGVDGQNQNRSHAHNLMMFGGTSPLATSGSYLTTSISSPSVLASSEDGQPSPLLSGRSTAFSGSPPPTSSSFTSFKTFGVGASPELPSPGATSVKTKSYGFSGGQGLREDEYIRRVKKSASHKDLKPWAPGKKAELEQESVPAQAPLSAQAPAKEETTLPSMISPEKANAYYRGAAKPRLSDSPTASERTATPMSSFLPSTSPIPRHPQGAFIPTLVSPIRDPDSPTSPTSPTSVSSNGVPQRKQRQSLLSGLTPAQVKRISMALEEIGGELRRSGSIARRDISGVEKLSEQDEGEEEEEVLATDKANEQEQANEKETGVVDLDLPSKPVDVLSEEESAHSATSSVFPWKVSPTNSTFTGKAGTEPASPSRLPPSPRAHNLRAQLDEAIPPIPTPIFTPTRVQPTPTRHTPSLSNGSASSTPTQVPPNSAYIPGQPRPVRLTHHSEGSMSSRSGTPSGHSPLDALRTSNATPRSQSPLDALRLSATSPDSHPYDASPSPLQHVHTAGAPSALGRSLSVNQASARQEPPSSFTRRRAGTVTLGETVPVRRLSSPAGTRVDIIEEGDEPQSDSEGYEATAPDDDSPTPELKQVAERHSVAASRYDSEASVRQLRPRVHHPGADGGLSPGDDHVERTVSAQGTIRTSYSTPGHSGTPSPALSPGHGVYRTSSSDSVSSSFVEPVVDELPWISVLDSRRESLDVPSPGDVMDGEMLRKMSGLGVEELAELQGKLVAKAKMEREAMGLSDSPAMPYTPTMPVEPFSPTIQRPLSPLGAQAVTSPMSGWQAPGVVTRAEWDDHRPTLDKAPAVSSAETHTSTPPSTYTSTPHHSRSSSKQINPTRAAPPVPSSPAPPVPSDASFQPPTANLSRAPSGKAGARTAADDPEVEKDFRTRIAAATAALNRNPSVQGGRLERKGTKRSGAMVISGPRLLSSTANVPTVPLTPPDKPVDPAVAKSLEKASGSGSKMSLRWKKLMRKGPSISGSDSAFKQPTVPQSAPLEAPSVKADTQAPAQMQRSTSSAAGRMLDTPIHLRTGDEAGAPPPSAPPNLDMFRFPPQQDQGDQQEVQTPRAFAKEIEPRTLSPENGPTPITARPLDQSHIPTPPASAVPATFSQIKEPDNHARAASEDSAVVAFLEAGRQIGLSEEQLNDMLVTKGMVKRSATTATSASSLSHQTAPLTTTAAFSHPSPVSPDVMPLQLPAARDKEKKGGLFRSLSKKARGTAPRPQTPEPTRGAMRTPEPTGAVATPPPPSERVHDKIVVRRTMIMPDGLVIVPSTPQRPSTLQDSPDLGLGRRPSQRKPSIRRKPLNLSKEDHALVSNSPPPHQPRFSINASPSRLSEASPQDGSGRGLGFLYPDAALGAGDSLRSRSNASESMSRSSISGRSSAGGSLIDMYGEDYDESEVLQDSPDMADRRQSGDTRPSLDQAMGSTHAVEICEYADGQVVWSIVDALRTSVAGSVDGEEYVFDGEHSRSSSYSSRRDSTLTAGGSDAFNGAWPRNGGLASGVQGLNFRHRDRSSAAAKPRPPTDVYFTSSRDVADLIDHLSRDLDASRGRIDIFPHSQSQSFSQSPAIDSESSPFPFQTSERHTPASPSANSQFEDAPSPAPPPRRAPPPARLLPSSFSASVPAGGFSPKRQLFVKQSIGHRQGQPSVTSMGSGAGMSPSAKSFSSSLSGVPGKSVEDRLQELMDRMRGEGLGRESG
ncbi:hypothetical protein IAT38_008280 [Cryptococcus sp. DSM 104549]